MKKKFIFIFCGLFLTGCMIGPNYKKPPVDLPSHYRGSFEIPSVSIGLQKWWDLFRDKKLQELIHMALNQNNDLLIAADHVLEAESQLNITSSYEWPTVNAQAGPVGQRYAKTNKSEAYSWGYEQINGSLTWDLDFWGKYRRMIEVSRANLLAQEWAQRQVMISLVADLAKAYFQLRELDLELEISKETVKAREQYLKLTKELADHGASSLLDVRQAEQLVYAASLNVPDIERKIGSQENLISVLLGHNPDTIERGGVLPQEPYPLEVPAGLPSELLLRRPDIRQSEAGLIAANAQIGVAQGAYFPDISLTASAGFQSFALSKLLRGPSGVWDVAASLTEPVFNAGRNRAGVKLAHAQQQEALHFYRKTIQEAFREVSDALVGYRKTRELMQQQDLLTEAAGDAARLSEIRYKGGSSSFLEVLTNDTNYYAAQINSAKARLSVLEALIDLYKALGGGW
ncbi:MAG: efflux transporter outer membrane subunit [Candidatus Omnitrophica bacterium]|nr:efflux transporter outer membrane subunit [Candidatus Omnitrophota bacterium]